MKKTYQERKAQAIETAQEWQQDQTAKSLGEYAEECERLAKLAKRYGLIKEFRENGII